MPAAEIAMAQATPWYVSIGIFAMLLPVIFFKLWKHIGKERAEIDVLTLNSQQNTIFKTSIDELSKRLEDARKDRDQISTQYYDLLKKMSQLTDEVVSLRHKVADQDTQMRLQAEALINQTRELAAAKVTIQGLTDQLQLMGGMTNGTHV